MENLSKHSINLVTHSGSVYSVNTMTKEISGGKLGEPAKYTKVSGSFLIGCCPIFHLEDGRIMQISSIVNYGETVYSGVV